MKTNNTLTVEDISMEDAANKYSDKIERSEDGAIQIAFLNGAKQKEQQLLPIIKELAEALKEIDETNNGIGIINTDWLRDFTKTTLDKYKNYL